MILSDGSSLCLDPFLSLRFGTVDISAGGYFMRRDDDMAKTHSCNTLSLSRTLLGWPRADTIT
jgi:hypothetical protein